MFHCLFLSTTRRRVLTGVLVLMIALPLSIRGVYTDVSFAPGIWVFFRGGLHVAVYNPVGDHSSRLGIAWTDRNGAIHNIVTASTSNSSFLQIGRDTTNWCGTGR